MQFPEWIRYLEFAVKLIKKTSQSCILASALNEMNFYDSAVRARGSAIIANRRLANTGSRCYSKPF